MGIIGAAFENLLDVRTLGTAVLRRHLDRLLRRPLLRIPVRNIGTLHARRDDRSDWETIRYTFARNPFDTRFLPALDARLQARYEKILASRRVPVILDAGANIGTTALWFANRYPEARIAAVEPDPGNIAMLERNCAHEPRIVRIDAAIGSTPGCVALTGGAGWAVQSNRSEEGTSIVTVDAAVEAAGDELFIAKINIEGFERDLFATNLGWLSGVEAVMIEPHDWLEPGWHCTRTLQQAMAAQPFEMFIREDFLIYARV